MAEITEKQTRRNRVQFTMPRQLYEAHQQNLELAKALGAIVEFNRDFEKWFNAQVDEVTKKLARMKEENSKQVPDHPKTSSNKAASNHSPSSVKKDDKALEQNAINYWLLPHFEEMSFYQICGTELKNFISTIKWKSGAKKGQLLSKKRVKNILVPFRAIFNDACEEFRWNLPDPFRNTRKHLPDTEEKEREVFRYDDWQLLLKHMDPWYVPIVEFMILTGTISSEIAGLRKSDIKDNHILIQNTIVRNREKQKTKTKYRSRKVPLTNSIRERLKTALNRSQGDYVFTKPTGEKFHAANFNNNIWKKALKKAGLSHMVPYCTRHSFAAWSLTLKVDMLRLVSLMGHKDKKMVFEVYGNYVEGLEQDALKILNYFGQDFIMPEIKQHAIVSMHESLVPQLILQMQQQNIPVAYA